MKSLLAFILGGVFALGLMISEMSNPKKVLDFLDIFGQWDASLAFVMMGAIAVAFVPFQYAIRATAPKTIFNDPILLPTQQILDSRLIMGSLMFGVGWGIAGICPAPSLTLIGLGHYEAFYFIGAMLLGMVLHRKLSRGA